LKKFLELKGNKMNNIVDLILKFLVSVLLLFIGIVIETKIGYPSVILQSVGFLVSITGCVGLLWTSFKILK
tara:strand:- start:605 stop:817 length:213 start_codon:yes stop_codon:yes gene_type:complete